MLESSHSRSQQSWLAGPVLAAATVTAYVGWLGWDQHKDVRPDGSLTGPYETWQIIGLVLTLAGIAFLGGRRGHTALAIVCIPTSLTICWTVDAVRDPLDQGLWPIGAIGIFCGTAVGVAVVARSPIVDQNGEG